MSFGPLRNHLLHQKPRSHVKTQLTADEDQVPKLDKAQRKAAGHCCMLLFHTLDSVGMQLQRVAEPRDKFKVGTWHGAGEGLSEREREFVRQFASGVRKDAETLRRLAHLFLKVDYDELATKRRRRR